MAFTILSDWLNLPENMGHTILMNKTKSFSVHKDANMLPKALHLITVYWIFLHFTNCQAEYILMCGCPGLSNIEIVIQYHKTILLWHYN